MTRFISWNVNGLRACIKKGFLDYFREADADFFCIQESKLQKSQIDESQFEPYYQYWNYAERKGYSGTAIFARKEPEDVRLGIGVEEHDHEGRVIALKYPDYYLVTVYTPNSQNELKRLDYRMQWEEDFRRYLKDLERDRPVIVCGDMNVAHEEIDIKNPKTNHMNAGFTDQEREKFTDLLQAGFIDSYRCLYPDKVEYSWWSYRFHAREHNAGWRIDYFLLSEALKGRIQDSIIHTDVMGSDHCPVELVLKD